MHTATVLPNVTPLAFAHLRDYPCLHKQEESQKISLQDIISRPVYALGSSVQADGTDGRTSIISDHKPTFYQDEVLKHGKTVYKTTQTIKPRGTTISSHVCISQVNDSLRLF